MVDAAAGLYSLTAVSQVKGMGGEEPGWLSPQLGCCTGRSSTQRMGSDKSQLSVVPTHSWAMNLAALKAALGEANHDRPDAISHSSHGSSMGTIQQSEQDETPTHITKSASSTCLQHRVKDGGLSPANSGL